MSVALEPSTAHGAHLRGVDDLPVLARQDVEPAVLADAELGDPLLDELAACVVADVLPGAADGRREA